MQIAQRHSDETRGPWGILRAPLIRGTVESDCHWRAHGRELAVEHRDPCSERLCRRIEHPFFTGLAVLVQVGDKWLASQDRASFDIWELISGYAKW